MTQEEKQELLIALCGYLPYGVMVNHPYFDEPQELDTILNYYAWEDGGFQCLCDDYGEHPHTLTECRPYLRPISSMTEEEEQEYRSLCAMRFDEFADANTTIFYFDTRESFDWLNKKMFDYRRLIPRGRAISTEEFNPYK